MNSVLIRKNIARYASTTAQPNKLHMIILGPPGSGKGTQIERLLKKWKINTLGAGDMLREEINKKTPVGMKAEQVMKAGGLLDDKTVLQLLEPGIQKLRHSDWILDGFPRKASQAKLLDETLGKSSLNLVVNLAVPDEVILSRIQARWIHPQSGRTYNDSFNPPKFAGKDDITGEPLERRIDDSVEVFQNRLKGFHAENTPLLAHYEGEQIDGLPKLVTLKGNTSDEITPQLVKLIQDRFPNIESS